jgi:DNA-directed RNA polymerase subunit N (RpoN/RPB10)
MRCPTCGAILGDIQKYYEKGLAEICKNVDLGKYTSSEQIDDAKVNLLNSTHLEKMCCRMRLLTYVKLIEIVK